MLSVPQHEFRGKGGRGSQGVSPWRSMRQRLMRAARRAASPLLIGGLMILYARSPEAAPALAAIACSHLTPSLAGMGAWRGVAAGGAGSRPARNPGGHCLA